MPPISVPGRCFVKGQVLHLLSLAVLLAGACLLVDLETLRHRRGLGVGAQTWFLVSLAVPIMHQVYVWFVWRCELCFGLVTKHLGTGAFRVYQVNFVVLLLARPTALTLLAISDYGSLALPLVPRIAICMILAIPAVYSRRSKTAS